MPEDSTQLPHEILRFQWLQHGSQTWRNPLLGHHETVQSERGLPATATLEDVVRRSRRGRGSREAGTAVHDGLRRRGQQQHVNFPLMLRSKTRLSSIGFCLTSAARRPEPAIGRATIVWLCRRTDVSLISCRGPSASGAALSSPAFVRGVHDRALCHGQDVQHGEQGEGAPAPSRGVRSRGS